MEKTIESKENIPKNSRDIIKDNLEDLATGFSNLWEILEKLGITEMSELSHSNAVIKDYMTFSNKEKKTKKKPSTLKISEIPCFSSKTSKTSDVNTLNSEVLNSSSNFSDNTGNLTSTIKCFDDVSDAYTSDTDILFDSIMETSNDTAKLLDRGSYATFSRKYSDIDSEVHATPNKNVLQSVEKHSISDSPGCVTETSMTTAKYSNNNSAVGGVFVTAEQVREGVQKAMKSLSEPKNPFDDFLLCYDINTFRDLNILDSESKSCGVDSKLLTKDQMSHIDQRSNNLFEFSDIDRKSAIIEEGYSSSDCTFNDGITCISSSSDFTFNDGIASISSDDEIFYSREDWEYRLKSMDDVEDPSKALHDLISGRNLQQSEYSMSSSTDSESCQSALQFSNQDVQSSHSNWKFSNNNQDIVKMNNNNNNDDEFLNFDEKPINTSEKSLHIDIILDNNRECKLDSGATVLKDASRTPTATDADWEQMSLVEKFCKNRRKLLTEFLSGGYQNISQYFDSLHCNRKLAHGERDLHIDKDSSDVLEVLEDFQRYMIENNLSPSQVDTKYDEILLSLAGSLENCSTLENDKRPSTVSTEMNDRDTDTITDVFKTVLKCHPLKKFEIPPYASSNADGAIGTTQKRMDDSNAALVRNCMQLHNSLENPPISDECSANIDSNSYMYHEIKDCFSQNSSIICDALIKEYLNTTVKLNLLLMKQVQDVSFEDCEKRMANLHCLDDELGYLSAKLITTRNDWIKQSWEIKENLKNNPQMTKSSKGLYHMSLLKTCMEITKILLNFCLEKQLELENYEKDLAFYHAYSD